MFTGEINQNKRFSSTPDALLMTFANHSLFAQSELAVRPEAWKHYLQPARIELKFS